MKIPKNIAPDLLPLAIRTHNPLNIRVTTERWQGQLVPSLCSQMEFCEFQNLEYGMRAALKLIRNYIILHGLTSPSEIVNRLAPSTENDTLTYIQYLERCLRGLSHISFADVPVVCYALSEYEAGRGYYDKSDLYMYYRLFYQLYPNLSDYERK